MPYYVFRISADRQLTLIDTFTKYQDAKAACREKRMAEAPGDPGRFRMAFAKSEKEAKTLLVDKREPSSPLEEWEA